MGNESIVRENQSNATADEDARERGVRARTSAIGTRTRLSETNASSQRAIERG